MNAGGNERSWIHRSSPLRRYAPAGLLALTIWTTAPFLGLARDALFARFPSSAVRGLAVALAVLLVVVVAAAIWRVARYVGRRPLQWTGLALVLALLRVQVHGFHLGIPESDIVEKIHIVEYGLLAILLYRAARRAPRLVRGGGDLSVVLVPLFGAALAGVVDESVQGFFQLRTGDIRDVALNALAGATGLTLALSVLPPASWRPLPGDRRRGLAVLVASTLLAAGILFHQAHLGYEIHDPQIGRFVSWFDDNELLRLQDDRARLWAHHPPTLKAWHPEDYYLTEAAWHAQHRNASLRADDLWAAAQANRVLEAYYAPFLDLESFRGSGVHRWPPALRDEIHSKHPPLPGIYLSPVLRSRVQTRISHGGWLAATAAVSALAFWFVNSWRQRLG